MSKKTTDTLLTVGAIGVSLVVIYLIFKRLSKPATAQAQPLIGGGSAGSSYAPFPIQPPTTPRPSISGNFGSGSQSTNSNFGVDPRQIAANGPMPDIDTSAYTLNTTIPYEPMQGAPDSDLLSFTPGPGMAIPDGDFLPEQSLFNAPDSALLSYTPGDDTNGIFDNSIDQPAPDSLSGIFDSLTGLDTSQFDDSSFQDGSYDYSQGAQDFSDPTQGDSDSSFGGDYGDSGDTGGDGDGFGPGGGGDNGPDDDGPTEDDGGPEDQN